MDFRNYWDMTKNPQFKKKLPSLKAINNKIEQLRHGLQCTDAKMVNNQDQEGNSVPQRDQISVFSRASGSSEAIKQ